MSGTDALQGWWKTMPMFPGRLARNVVIWRRSCAA